MFLPRVIPCLLLKGGGLVKTVKFKSETYVGDPINAVRIFNEKQVDELIVLDISASRERREPDFELIEEIASECFMPLCYGGGIDALSKAQRAVGLGVEKVAVNHAAVSRPELVRDLAAELGSQSVVACIDVKKSRLGHHKVYDSARRRMTNRDPLEHAEQLAAMGAGEVMVNSVDRDGTQEGFDYELIRRFSEHLSVPIIACGGAGTLEHIRTVVSNSGASAAAAGSMFVFQGPHRAVLISYPPYSELVELLSN